jgi:asparagine synthase (glutamine-hydrolysing)
MCGIFAILNMMTVFIDKETIKEQFQKGANRGPDDSNILDLYIINCMLGFHRLAINGLNDKSNQPFYIENIFLACNGEIYNYKELYALLDEDVATTDSDCEVIIHLYLKYGMDQTIRMLDGEFAFILIDTRMDTPQKKIFVGRDPYGVRPLYILSRDDGFCPSIYAFASDMKQLINFHKPQYSLQQYYPGTFSCYTLFSTEYNSSEFWMYDYQTKYHEPLFSFRSLFHEEDILLNIRKRLETAVEKRCKCSERPIACLLSGGLDSSLITALVKQHVPQLETFSIGFENSEDLKHARIVADYLGTKHHEIIITKEEYLETIPHVIYTIESHDTTTVRASVGNYLVAKYISKNSDAKVIFNGDGSDELCGGYMYMNNCPDAIEFDKETRRLLRNIHYFDVLRSDKSISSNGLEARTPFLDLDFTQYYLSIHPSKRFHPGNNQPEKYLLRKAFDIDILPKEILWRTKEAFSDGVTIDSISNIIQSFVLSQTYSSPTNCFPVPVSQEEKYYRSIYNDHYPETKAIPFYWKPKYLNVNGYIDPSARTMNLIKSNNEYSY